MTNSSGKLSFYLSNLVCSRGFYVSSVSRRLARVITVLLDGARSSTIHVNRSRVTETPNLGVTIERFIHPGGASFLMARAPGFAQETLRPAGETEDRSARV